MIAPPHYSQIGNCLDGLQLQSTTVVAKLEQVLRKTIFTKTIILFADCYLLNPDEDVIEPVTGMSGHPELEQSIYNQLYRLAERALTNERPGHSLQPTLIVNDAYLRLLEQKNVDPADRSQVMAVGATIIRRLLVDYARRRQAMKRGGADGRGVELNVSVPDRSNVIDVLELNDTLISFGEHNPRAAKVVELRFFGGLTNEAISLQLGISTRTVNNDWRYAKAWLYQRLAP